MPLFVMPLFARLPNGHSSTSARAFHSLGSMPLLTLWPWASLTPAELWAAFCELSRVPPTPLADHLCRHPMQRQQQQAVFVTYQLSLPGAASAAYSAHPLLVRAPGSTR